MTDPLNKIFTDEHPAKVYKEELVRLRKLVTKKGIKSLLKKIKVRDKQIKTLKSVLKDYQYYYKQTKKLIKKLGKI